MLKKLALTRCKIKNNSKRDTWFFWCRLSKLINESALLAARKNKRVVTMSDIEEAKDKVMMVRREDLWSCQKMKLTAYHEGATL